MALPVVRIPSLQAGRAIVDQKGAPALDFQRWINDGFKQLQTAQNATNAALVAAGIATAAAAAATAAATAANDAAEGSIAAQSLANSYTDPTYLLTATDAGTDASIAIIAHDRIYPDDPNYPTPVAVNSGMLTGLAYSTEYFVFYSDPTRAGGAVTYQASTNFADAAQVAGIHSVGAVVTPAAAGPPETGGGGPRPPGVVLP